jgi:hypothetical protein
MNTITNLDRFLALTGFVKSYDADVLNLFYTKVKPTKAWFDYCFSDCQESAKQLHDQLLAMAEKFLTSIQFDELEERLKLWALHIEVAQEYAQDDLSCFADESEATEGDLFQDKYDMFYNEY